MPGKRAGFTIGVDVGGTFTDVMALETRTGRLRVAKFPTSEDPARSIALALKDLGVAPSEVELLSHATTMSTNALLTRTGLVRTALVTNDGFRDVLEIGRQRRPELYDLDTRRPPPLIERRDRYTIGCRTSARGEELEPIDSSKADEVLSAVVDGSYGSVAVCFLNAYANPVHEMQVRDMLANQGFRGHVSLSSEVDNEYREYERMSTTAVNAAIAPMMTVYLKSLAKELARVGVAAPLFVMNSDGGASTVAQASSMPVHSIESGPAAGVVASKRLADVLSMTEVLTFDMGGTTAKAGCLVGGEAQFTREFEAAGRTHSGRSIRGSGYAVRGSFIDLAEVSAGGGTVAWLDEAGQLRAGPRSSGSLPGPACYDRGGVEPTVTDANVVLGKLNPTSLLGGRMPIDRSLASRAFGRLSRRTGAGIVETASGVVRLVNDAMARAISIVSVERGLDPRDFTLFAFGGAGPLHACDLAEDLGISRIFVPTHAGLFSAYGLIVGDLERTFTAPVMGERTTLRRDFRALEQSARRQMESDGLPRYSTRRYFEARYVGQSHELLLPYGDSTDIRKSFELKHKRSYGYSTTDAIEVVNIIVKLTSSVGRKVGLPSETLATVRPQRRQRRVWVRGQFSEVDVRTREALQRGAGGRGPCMIEEYDSTLLVNPGWRWRVVEQGVLLQR